MTAVVFYSHHVDMQVGSEESLFNVP